MKKLLMVLVMMPLMALADTEVVDGIEWTYLISGGKVQIGTGQWASPAIPVETTGAVTIPSTLGGFPVRSIGICAFYGCDRLTSVTVPSNVKSVGDYAFYGCYSLLSATIPSSVTSIGSMAFDSCNILIVFVTDDPQECVKECFGDEILYQKIGTPINYEWDFSYADGLAAVTGVWPPIGNVVIPSISNGCPVERIEGWAFGGCSGLTSVTIPSSVKSIGDHAFCDCIGLTSVSMSDGVTNIGECAFSGCVGLTSVTIPPTVKSIANEAFYYCSSLPSVTIPSGVTSVGDRAFGYCDGLMSVTIPDGMMRIGDGAFYCCEGLASVTIPSSVTSIGDEAFYCCGGLMSLTLSEGVTSIGDWAFFYCDKLTSVTIPEGVTNIGECAFECCNGLRTVTIPSSVMSIGDDAFGGCGRMISMEFEGAPPVGFEYADIKRDVMLWYNAVYEEEWLTVLEECGFKNHMPYVPGEKRPDGGPYVEFIDGIEWTYLIVDGEAYIGAGWNSRAVPWDTAGDIVVPTQLGGCEVRKINDGAFDNLCEITSIELPVGLTDIGANAFSYCDRLESIKIPNGVTNIGYQAFCSCASLSEIRLPVDLVCIGDAAFLDCSSLEAIDLPLSVTRIGMHAFYGCVKLKSIGIPPSVVSIGDYAFLSCGGLKVIEVDPDNANYASVDGVLYDKTISTLLACGGGKAALAIPSSVLTVEAAALSCCDNLETIEVESGNANFISVEGVLYDKMLTTVIACGAGRYSVSIYSGVTNIGICAFAGCDKLTDLKLPNGTTCIGEEAFSGCSGLKSIYLPNSVVRIGDFAFSSCSGLTSVSIPSNVTSIGNSVFQGCSGLAEMMIPNGVTNIGDYAFWDCEGLKSVTIPDGVVRIGDSVFCMCVSLSNVVMPPSVTSIGDRAFAYCWMLESVMIQEGVRNIGECAFEGCPVLKCLTIPESVERLGRGLFAACESLKAIDFKGSPPEGLAESGIESDVLIRYNIAYEKEWTEWLTEHPEFSAAPYLRTWYVNEVSIAGKPDGRSWAAAFRQIQDAVNVATNDDTIVVGPGKYLPVSVAVDRLRIKSVEGAAQTVIEAEPYSSSGTSYSTIGGGSCFNACANYDLWSTYEGRYVDCGQQIGQGVWLDGFTLRKGFAKGNSYAIQYGGGVMGGVVANCIIEENYSTCGGGAYKATLENCIVRNNRGVYGTGAMSCVLRHCTVVNNRHSGEVLLYATECAEDEGVAIAGSSTMEDCIVVNNFDAMGEENNYYHGGTVISTSGNSYSTIQVVVSNTVVKSSCARPLASGNGNIAEDPCLVDWESGDCRLRSGSPCIARGMGAIPYNNEFDAIATASGAEVLHWAADEEWRAKDGVVAVGNIGDGRMAVVDAVTEGSGWLRFEWKCDSASGRDRVNFFIDGVGARAMTGIADWKTVMLRVEGGQSHKFAWKLIKAKSGAADGDGAYVRNVKWIADVERLTIGEALGQPEWKWVSDGWRVAQDGDVEGGYYVESMSLGDDSAAMLSTMVEGPAELAFSWKVSSEAEYDYLDFFIDGEYVAWVDGERDWEVVLIELTNGVHKLDWVYFKDEAVSVGYDRAWIRDVMFKNTTLETPVEVPYSWLDSYPALMTIAKGDYETAAAMSVVKVSSSGSSLVSIPVWKNYVAGIDPTDSNDVFTATISVSEGVPSVSYTPNLGDARKYKIWGKKFLTDKTWKEVPFGREAEYNFFKVTVEMK